MPVKPYTWQQQDYLTASRLNNECYLINGLPFQPNGIAWHAARPIFKTIQPVTLSSLTTAWTPMNGGPAGVLWNTIADTASYYGSKGDSANTGVLSGTYMQNGGGAGHNGGYGLMMALNPFSTSASGVSRCGLGVWNASTPTWQGTCQPFSGNPSTPFAIGLVDLGASNWSGFFQASVAGLSTVPSSADGSGVAARQSAFWASVYPAYGATASAPNPVSTWASGSPAITAALMNGVTGLAGPLNVLNMPPLLSVSSSVTSSCANNTATLINYTGGTAVDTYGAWSNSGSSHYTIPLSGLYLVAAFTPFDAFGAGGYHQTGVQINGTNYLGPINQATSGLPGTGAKVQIFSLNAGDTVSQVVQQGTGSTVGTSASVPSYMIIYYLGQQGTPSPIVIPPDVSNRWQAGTPAASMPALMNAHFANDLNFLTQRPYLLAYQTSVQAAFAQNSATPLVLQSVTGQVHGDSSDNYSGWTSGTSNAYTCQRTGWYLCVQESQIATPTLTTNPVVAAAFAYAGGGSANTDYYQKQGMRIGGATGGGACAIGMYYMSVGDTITPIIWTNNSSSTTIATAISGQAASHFECVWLSE